MMPINMPRGRPPEDEKTRDRMVHIRCTAEQEECWRIAAELDGASGLSEWLRDLADDRCHGMDLAAEIKERAARVRHVLESGIEKARRKR